VKKCENWLIFSEDMDKVRLLSFLGHPVYTSYCADTSDSVTSIFLLGLGCISIHQRALSLSVSRGRSHNLHLVFRRYLTSWSDCRNHRWRYRYNHHCRHHCRCHYIKMSSFPSTKVSHNATLLIFFLI